MGFFSFFFFIFLSLFFKTIFFGVEKRMRDRVHVNAFKTRRLGTILQWYRFFLLQLLYELIYILY